MNKFKTFLILFISFLLQSTIFSKIDIFGANINLMIPAIVAISQILGPKIGGYGGLIAGLFEDFLFTEFIGIRALSYFLIGSFVSSPRFNFGKDKPTGALMTALASIFHFILVSIIYYFLIKQSVTMDYLPLPLIIEVGLNTLIYLVYIQIVKKVMYIPIYRI